MYKPAPPRPRKTNNKRKRTGCKVCKAKRLKCDESKPSCSTCTRLGIECQPLSPKFVFRTFTAPAVSSKKQAPQQSVEESDGDVDPSAAAPDSSTIVTVRSSGAIPSDSTTPGIYRLTIRHDVPAMVSYYTTVWDEDCLPAVHAFYRPWTSYRRNPALLNIIISCAASRMSRRLPQPKLTSNASTTVAFRPDVDHEIMSHRFYGASIRHVATWDVRRIHDPLGLATLVAFCYLEATTGNFQNFRLHSDAVKVILRGAHHELLPQGNTLLAAWVDIEAQTWWRRVYFGTPDFFFNSSLDSWIDLEPQITSKLHAVDTKRASVLLILCESYRVYCQAVLTSFQQASSLDGHIQKLSEQSQLLHHWHARLSTDDLPVVQSRDSMSFRSHEAAMNFAYYITAKVVQSVRPLELLQNHSSDKSAYSEAEEWITLLLKIADTISWKDCIRLNIYRLGFADLLLTCALHSHTPAIGLKLQMWLEEVVELTDIEEGNFPVCQILSALRLVNEERKNGWDVFALFQAMDDGGGSGKFGSYLSQDLRSLVVYARSRETGQLCVYQRPV